MLKIEYIFWNFGKFDDFMFFGMLEKKILWWDYKWNNLIVIKWICIFKRKKILGDILLIGDKCYWFEDWFCLCL